MGDEFGGIERDEDHKPFSLLRRWFYGVRYVLFGVMIGIDGKQLDKEMICQKKQQH